MSYKPYKKLSHSTTWSGIWATAQSGTLDIILADGILTLKFPEVVSTYTTSSYVSMDTLLPMDFRPASEQIQNFIVEDGGLLYNTGEVKITITGGIEIRPYEGGTYFGTGDSGFRQQVVMFEK